MTPLALLFTGVLFVGAQGYSTVRQDVVASNLGGVVKDPNGAIVPHAHVSLINCENGAELGFEVRTDNGGHFALRPGNNALNCVRIVAPGFDPLELHVKHKAFAGNLHPVLVIAT